MMNGFADFPVVEDVSRRAISSGGLLDDGARGPAELLNQTVNTQPLMLIAGVACWRAWREKGGPMPAWFAGHSLGEYSALVAAESLRFEDAVPLVRLRAQAMQEAVPEGTGGIAAIIGLDAAKVVEVCRDAAQGEVLEPANLNSPVQVDGACAAVERAMALPREGASAR
jgi:[acyl-carrier-protein] S-malonyltransferase